MKAKLYNRQFTISPTGVTLDGAWVATVNDPILQDLAGIGASAELALAHLLLQIAGALVSGEADLNTRDAA